MLDPCRPPTRTRNGRWSDDPLKDGQRFPPSSVVINILPNPCPLGFPDVGAFRQLGRRPDRSDGLLAFVSISPFGANEGSQHRRFHSPSNYWCFKGGFLPARAHVFLRIDVCCACNHLLAVQNLLLDLRCRDRGASRSTETQSDCRAATILGAIAPVRPIFVGTDVSGGVPVACELYCEQPSD